MCPHRARRQEAGGGETEAVTHRWHRTQSLDHQWKVTYRDDWTLVDENGEHIARVFDLGVADLLGAWRWWVRPFYEIDNV
jgi:hypothetical protein